MNTLLEIKNVTKYFGSGDAVSKALNGVSFNMERGEFTAVMGASGSGKSTLLNVIATIDRPSSGSIALEGSDIAKMPEQDLAAFRRDHLGFIFQEYNLLDTLTVAENIVLPLNLRKCPVRETEQRLEKVASSLEITDQLSKFPRQLSGGQRQFQEPDADLHGHEPPAWFYHSDGDPRCGSWLLRLKGIISQGRKNME